ncbi:DNA-processing protein DprA [Paractinoplanes globisporus]|uniref:DNA-processing protein DprA n=1 Tax=Paractinoplanes globisporus TaxID=113565 RepID=A0ABW6WHK1_9ACTN|nr:DNA-processing protein DprA [Actinoplanes globisporus]
MTDRHDDRAARVALSHLVEPGNLGLHEMVRDGGAVVTVQRLLSGDIPDESLRARLGAAFAVGGDPRRRADAALHRAERFGARVVVPGDDEWPASVDDLGVAGADGRIDPGLLAPLCLWVRGPGSLRDCARRSVAVVGARAATAYGIHACTDLASGLAEHGWSIVAGGAFGIDAAAHRAALSRDSCTVAVLACGVDRLYPAGNAALLEQIAACGLLVSEYPLGTEPVRHRFLARNRLVAAVASGAVLVEAARRSGSIHMMGRVLDLHRPAMVVPGPITSALSAGCHELLRTRPEATLVTETAHILEALDRAEIAATTPPTSSTSRRRRG